MLEQLSEQVQEYQERAAQARGQAERATDPALKADLFDLEKRWLDLARAQAFAERLGDLTAANSDRRRKSEERDALRLQELSTLRIADGKLDTLYERILDTAISLMSSDFASLQILNSERRELRLLASRGFHPRSAAHWELVRLDSTCACGLALSSGCRVVIPDVEASDTVAGTPDLDEYRRSGIRAVQSTPLLSRSGELLGMISTHWAMPRQPGEHALRQIDVLARQAADLIEHGKVEAALRESEERRRWLASIVESSDDAIVSKSLEGIITSWNKGAERIFGYTAEEAVGQPITILIPPDRQDEERQILERIRRGERIEHYETVRQRRHGSLIVVSLTVSPVKNAAGKIVGASKIARDVTERKRADEEIATLAREAEHRTKNVLATVQATVNLSQADTAAGLKHAIEGRIQALANTHSLFVQSRWSGAELSNLAAQELAPYLQGEEARVQIVGPTLVLEPNTAQAVAMTLHELATNAAKYGALSAAKGRLEVTWSLAAGGGLTLRWAETGGPPVTPPTRQGFGTRVIERMIRGQLKGGLRLDWRPEGLVCEIALPV